MPMSTGTAAYQKSTLPWRSSSIGERRVILAKPMEAFEGMMALANQAGLARGGAAVSLRGPNRPRNGAGRPCGTLRARWPIRNLPGSGALLCIE